MPTEIVEPWLFICIPHMESKLDVRMLRLSAVVWCKHVRDDHETHYGAVDQHLGALKNCSTKNTDAFFHFSYDSSVAAALVKQKSKEDSEQENSSDARDPSVEEEERLLALDKDIYDEEDETIAQDVANESQESQDSYCGTGERKLVCVDETSKFLMLCFKTRILRRFCNTSVILFPTFCG